MPHVYPASQAKLILPVKRAIFPEIGGDGTGLLLIAKRMERGRFMRLEELEEKDDESELSAAEMGYSRTEDSEDEKSRSRSRDDDEDRARPECAEERDDGLEWGRLVDLDREGLEGDCSRAASTSS